MFCAVIFDWDGTLADSKNAVVASFQKVFQESNIVVSNEFIEKRIGIGSRNLIIDALKASNVPFDDKLLNTLLNGKIEAEIELTSMVNLFDGAIKLLNSVRGKMKTALASMNNRAVIDRLLDEKGVRGYFDIVLAAEDVVKAKPDPEIFLKTALGLSCPPEKCVVMEDYIWCEVGQGCKDEVYCYPKWHLFQRRAEGTETRLDSELPERKKGNIGLHTRLRLL
jgi:HAD superfamily hydrolase (TIGR01509 family)